ncbi:MAG TPA: DUF2127 domain-containing protein [Actinomycetota bacterium]|nr:DUF2127 domain-containing protein [Actinomycetota bacterium]
MSQAGPDEHRTRFRRPLGVAVMAYKAILGLSEITVGLAALISRQLPALVRHRDTVAVGLVLFGLAKLVAAAAMWEGHEWGCDLLAATVALLLPFDVRQAVVSPTPGHVLLAAANAAVLVVLVLLLRGWLPSRPLRTRADRT